MNYVCKKADRSRVDWSAVEAVELKNCVSGAAPERATLAKMIWDESGFTVRFDYDDANVCAHMSGYNELIYKEDVVEIFIDDDADGADYLELELNPNNAVLFYYIMNRDGAMASYARLVNTVESEFRRDGEHMTGIMHIPASEFKCAPKAGAKWRANLYRIDRASESDASDEHAKFLAWSPTGEAAFHRPGYFGEISFE